MSLIKIQATMFFSQFLLVVLALVSMQASAFHARAVSHHPIKTTATVLQSQPMKNKRGIFDVAVSKLPEFHWMAPAKKMIHGLSNFTRNRLSLLRSNLSPVVAAFVLALVPGLAFAELLKTINSRKLWFEFGAFIVPFTVSALACYSPAKEVKNDLLSMLPKAIEESRIEPASKQNVERKGLDKQIAIAGDCVPSDQYFIVYGAKGAGKSHAVDHFFSCREAVIKLLVTTVNTKDDVISVISKKLLGIESIKLDPESLVAAVKRSKITPTIIFDVDRGGSPDQTLGLQAVRSLSKLLAPFCRCFIVLSEASAVLELIKDPDRDVFIFAGEMTIGESKEFLGQQNRSFTDDQFDSVYRNLGDNPAKLKAMSSAIKSGSSIKVFVT